MKNRNLDCPVAVESLNAGVICCKADENMTFLWANTAFYALVGYSGEELSNRFPGLSSFFAEACLDDGTLKRGLQHALERGEGTFELDTRFPHRDGFFQAVRVKGSVCADGGSGEKTFQAVLTDVSGLTGQKEEMTRLYRQKLEYFQWMLDLYIGNVYISDMETNELLYLNKTALDTLGLSSEQVLGRKCYEVIQGKTAPCSFCTNDRISEEEFYDWEFYNPVLKRNFMIKNRVIHWNGHRARIELSHDMYSAEFKLAKKDREKEVLIQSIPGGFARLDARDYRTVLWYGSDFLDIIGYTAEQFKRELHSQCTYVHPDDLERIVAVLRGIKETGEKVVLESRIITRSGRIKIIVMGLCYAGGEDSWDGIPSFYSVGLEVTREREEQARQKKALEDAYELARVSNDAKTNFLSSMSHDIRTPMNAIMGMTAIAQANISAPERVNDCLEKINVSGRHLLSLINEVLDMSRIESGKIALAEEEVFLPDLVRNIADICRPLAAEKKQEFRLSMNRVTHERVCTDGGRLQQVLMNLVSNAVKYTQEGGRISLQLRESPSIIADQGQYEFIIADNGIGMPDEFMEHIFEPFARAEDPRISKIQGTGLGLAITENIVRMMNGTIEVNSRLGAGSKFIVSVPFRYYEDTAENRDAVPSGRPALQMFCGSGTAAAAEAPLTEKSRMLAGRRILLVEDNELNREIAVELLEMNGMLVDTAENGLAAVEQFRKSFAGYYDSILMDIQMPVLNGYEATKQIRGMDRPDAQTIPIFALTANAFASDIGKAHSVGMNEHISKPINIGYLLEVLQKWIV